MNRLTKSVTYLIWGLFVTCGALFQRTAAAQDVSPFSDSAGRATIGRIITETTSAGSRSVPFEAKYRAYSQWGNGQGWEDGQTYVSIFYPIHLNPWTDLIFIDARGFLSYQSIGEQAGGNIGIGYRRNIADWNTILGASVWFDVDGAHNTDNETWIQYGASLEAIVNGFEMRVNGYLAEADGTRTITNSLVGTPFFQRHFIMMNRLFITDHQFDGFDAEMGGLVPFLESTGLHFYAGGYFLHNDDFGEAGGYKFRWQANLHEDVQIGMEYRKDRIFGSSTWGNVMFQLPNKPWRLWWRDFLKPKTTVDYLARQVERNYRIPVKRRQSLRAEPLIDPRDNQPIFVLHVNPGGSAGNGTFENPYNSSNFSNSSNVDIIRVLPGNFTRPSTLTLFNNQRLLAANHQHFVVATQGTFILPSQVTGANPVITNTAGGNVIQLASNNEVSGFDINGGGTGIGIVGNGIADFNLNRLNITNATDGIQITNFTQTGQPLPFGQPNTITDVTVTGSTMNGVSLIQNTGLTGTVAINNLQSGGNGQHGLAVAITNNSTVNLTLTGSTLGAGENTTGNTGDGFNLTADSGTANLIIGGPNAGQGNVFAGNGSDGLDFDISGTAVATIIAQNNTVGSGLVGSAVTTGVNFTGTVSASPATSIPPDTMGGVGPNHIVELINGSFTVYDKNGNQLSTSSLDAFWTAAGVTIPAGESTFDPRIIYDPTTGRWFAVSIDGQVGTGAGNRIYVAVSNSSDPTAGWTGFQFQADTAGTRFNDFDTLGIDANGLYISTNNFVGGTSTEVSLYAINKANLIAGTLNVQRFENLSAATVGFTPQPAVDLNSGDAINPFISASATGQLTRTDIQGTAPSATLSTSTNITVAADGTAGDAKQPGPNDNINTDNDRISGNIVQVGNSLWVVRTVQDAGTGNAAVRWVELDMTTNTVKQTGLISDPNLDFYEPSVAVNNAGQVVIGFSGSGDAQSVSTYAAVGQTNSGTTTFAAPLLLKQGTGSYQVLDTSGRNRWGDYSATVVDPSNSRSFWTFQEYVNGNDTWAVQITQLLIGTQVAGNTNDGWRINVRDNAVLMPSTFNNNVFQGNGNVGLNIIGSNNANIQNLTITNNQFLQNVTGLMLTANDSALINATVNNNLFNNNTGTNTGFHALASGGTINIASLMSNTASNNANGNGFRFEATSGGLLTLANATGNLSSSNGLNGMYFLANGAGSRIWGTLGSTGGLANNFLSNTQSGLFIEARDGGSIAGPGGAGAFAIANGLFGNTGQGNGVSGIRLLSTGTVGPPVSTLIASVDSSTLNNNTLGGLDARVEGNSDLQLTVTNSTFDTNTDFGMRVTSAESGTLTLLSVQTSTFQNTVDNAGTTNFGDGTGEGILLVREGASSFGVGGTATIGAVGSGNTIQNNASDGIRVFGTGDPNVANRVDINGNTITSNTGNGLNIDLHGNVVFLTNAAQNTISSSGANGIRIASWDNASTGNIFTFSAGTPTASASVFDGNIIQSSTLDGISIITPTNNPPLDNNESWQNIFISGVAQRTTIDGSGNNGITINNSAVPTVAGLSPTRNYFTIQGTDITNSTADGINILLTGGESNTFAEFSVTRVGANTVNIGGSAAGQDVTISNSGQQGVDVTSSHSDTGLVGTTQTTVSVAGTDTINVDSLTSSNNTSDGFRVFQNQTSNITFNMLRSTMSNNGGVGLSIDIRSTNAGVGTTVYNIGSDVAGEGNTFSGNTLQGVFFQTLSPTVTSNTISSANPNATAATTTDGLFADQTVTFATEGRFNFFGNTVSGNGTAGNNADGVVVVVGTNTNVIAAISQNTFSANAGNDLNLVNIASGNPANSTDNAAPTNDVIVTDPVGFLDLALGLNFVGTDPPVTGETPSGALPNTGFTFNVQTIGLTTALAGRTELGLFTNSDAFKPANRNSFMVVRVYDANPSVLNNNVFSVTGPVLTTLTNANLTIGGGGNPPGGPLPTFSTIQLQPLGAVFP